jgi:hypothetical protein
VLGGSVMQNVAQPAKTTPAPKAPATTPVPSANQPAAPGPAPKKP